MNIFWIAVGLFVLGLMVLAHEWGHFIVARLCRVRVEIFSVGFGPRLWGRKRGDTDYRLSAFPLGGYVKMAGDTPGEECDGAPDEFLSKPRPQRALIILAGPAMNILLAVALLSGLYMFKYEKEAFREERPVVHDVLPNSPAAIAGIQAGDLIVAIDGAALRRWEDVAVKTILSGGASLQVTVERQGQRREVSLQPELRGPDRLPLAGWLPYHPIVITEVEPGLPAAEAGFEAGDEIVTLEGESTSRMMEENPARFPEAVQKSEGKPLALVIRRGGRQFEQSVTPRIADWRGQKGYVLGVSLGARRVLTRLGPLEAVQHSVADNFAYAAVLVQLVERLFTGRVSVGNLEGPIGITVLSGRAARLGLDELAKLMALISMNLGILNLLPIPILDGGHLAFLLVEGTLRRDLSLRVKERVMQLGFAFLMLLFLVVMYNDVLRYFFR